MPFHLLDLVEALSRYSLFPGKNRVWFREHNYSKKFEKKILIRNEYCRPILSMLITRIAVRSSDLKHNLKCDQARALELSRDFEIAKLETFPVVEEALLTSCSTLSLSLSYADVYHEIRRMEHAEMKNEMNDHTKWWQRVSEGLKLVVFFSSEKAVFFFLSYSAMRFSTSEGLAWPSFQGGACSLMLAEPLLPAHRGSARVPPRVASCGSTPVRFRPPLRRRRSPSVLRAVAGALLAHPLRQRFSFRIFSNNCVFEIKPDFFQEKGYISTTPRPNRANKTAL